MKTQDQIETEIDALKEIKPRVVRRSFFGDNNHAAIDAQIEALSELWEEDDIHENFESGYHEMLATEHARDSALDAANWLHADETEEVEAPSDSWKGIVK
jgi:hypothetical protein